MSMKNEAFQQALKVLEKRRLDSEIVLSGRLDEIARNLPEVMAVRQKLAMTGAEISKMILQKRTDIVSGIERIRTENLSLQEEEKRLLRGAGLPENYLTLTHRCPNCKDNGYVGEKRCGCLESLVRQIGIETLNRVSALRLADFESFELSYYADTVDPVEKVIPRRIMKEIFAFCRRYAEEFTPQAQGIFMMGETGLGKTHLSLAIAREVIRKGYAVAYGSAQDFLRSIENEHFGRGENKETLATLLDVDLLILDDLGAEFATQFNLSTLYNLINTRCNQEKPTIVNTNLTTRELQDKYSQRVVSRLLFSRFTALTFVGKDIRQLKSQRQRGM